MNRKLAVTVAVVVLAAAALYLLIKLNEQIQTPPPHAEADGNVVVSVVAAENFYGNIAEQLGGNHIWVTSILSDPNVDPHEYESSVADGIAVTNAGVVIANGLQYDTWINKLLHASPNPNRILVTAGDVAPDLLPDNPHVWYGIDNIPTIARTITDALEKADPTDIADFESNLSAFNASLAPVQAKMDEIKTRYAKTPIGLTETIYLYQTQAMGLNVLTPLDFEKAIAEGNDPSAQSVSTANAQVSGKNIKVLVYNSQTVTPITTNIKNSAKQKSIPIVPITEMLPHNATYQTWMMSQLTDLEDALAQSTGTFD